MFQLFVVFHGLLGGGGCSAYDVSRLCLEFDFSVKLANGIITLIQASIKESFTSIKKIIHSCSMSKDAPSKFKRSENNRATIQ